MHVFTDTKGDAWRLAITVGHIKPVEADTGVNLLKMDKPFQLDADDWRDDDGKPLILLTRLELDLELLYSVIYSLCREEAAERKIDEVEFGKRLGISDNGHDAFEDAHSAFWDEAKAFFHQTRRHHVASVIAKQRDLIDKAMTKLDDAIAKTIDTDAIVNRIFGSLSGDMPESLASTRDQ